MDDLSQIFGSQFDAGAVPPMDDFAPILPANYLCLIEKAEIKETKSRTGYGLSLQLSVVEGTFAGRKIFDFINIDNPNNVAQEIGRRVLSALAIGVGLRTLGPVSELVNKAIVAHVKVKDDRNNVRTYSAPKAAPPVAASPAVAPVTPVVAPVPAMDPAVHSQTPGYYAPSPAVVPVAPPVTMPGPPQEPLQRAAVAPTQGGNQAGGGLCRPAPVVAPVAPVVPMAAPVAPAPTQGAGPVGNPPAPAAAPPAGKPWNQDEIPF